MANNSTVPAWLPQEPPDIIANPEATVISIVWNAVVVPALEFIVIIFQFIINAILLLFLGSNHQLGGEEEVLGLLDLPIAIAVAVTGVGQPFGAIIDVVETFNQAVVGAAANAGLAAPLVTGIVIAIELTVGLYVVNLIITLILLQLGLPSPVAFGISAFRRVVG